MLRKLEQEFGDQSLEAIRAREIERYLTRKRNVDGVAIAPAGSTKKRVSPRVRNCVDSDPLGPDHPPKRADLALQDPMIRTLKLAGVLPGWASSSPEATLR